MDVISPKDYYNEQGILLVAKGIPIPLKKLEAIQENYPTVQKESELCVEQTEKLKIRLATINGQILSKASEILIKIMFESKQKPWWIHINALSNRLDWVYTHSIDVALISLMMGIELNFSEKDLFEVGIGALLHDIGKLLIPKDILEKLEPLTKEEQAIFAQHCKLGLDCTAGCSLTESSTNVIIQHHERMDGSGYPNALKEDEISEYTQIVTIADMFDAYTAPYPYENPKDLNESLALLKAEEGKYSAKFLAVLERVIT